jgi:hypothetical protein
MSAEYWDAFHRNAKETLQARAPHGWTVTEIQGYSGRVVARLEWAEGHSMTLDTHAGTENDALEDIVQSLDKLRNQQWGTKE